MSKKGILKKDTSDLDQKLGDSKYRFGRKQDKGKQIESNFSCTFIILCIQNYIL